MQYHFFFFFLNLGEKSVAMHEAVIIYHKIPHPITGLASALQRFWCFQQSRVHRHHFQNVCRLHVELLQRLKMKQRCYVNRSLGRPDFCT